MELQPFRIDVPRSQVDDLCDRLRRSRLPVVASNADFARGPAVPERVEVPPGFALFPREAPSPREWCERQADVVRFTRMPRGGHFAALEVPDDVVAEIRAFVGDLPPG